MSASPAPSLSDRLIELRLRVRAAAELSGRSPSDVTLMAATKTVSPEIILEAARLGVMDIGENRVQEAEKKHLALAAEPDIVRHFIGQLQTNKARQAVSLFDIIESVDRLKVAEAVSKAAHDAGKFQRILVEVKISDEAAKGGIPPSEADAFIEAVSKLPSMTLEGVMAVAPFDRDEAETRAAFRKAAEVFQRNIGRFGPKPILSMGMTDDFEWAIAEGSTQIRVGRALFGERKTNA